MAHLRRGEPPALAVLRLDGGAVVRLAIGFCVSLLVWLAFAGPYERTLAGAAQEVIRTFERPAVTTLTSSHGDLRVDRADFPPASPRPGLPAADIHFNFVLLGALFALAPHPLRPRPFGRFWIAAGLLWILHVAAIVLQVESLYATRLGPWSAEHYGPLARNAWAAGFHFYQIAGRFAAPFVLWWVLGRTEPEPSGSRRRRP